MRIFIKIVKANLRMLYVRERLVLSLILTCSFCSGIMLPLIYGVYYNYSEKLNAQRYDLTLLQVRFTEGKSVNKDAVKAFVQALPKDVTDCIDMFYVTCRNLNGKVVECRFTLQENEYRPCLVFRDNLMESGILYGYFAEEEEAAGENVAIVSCNEAKEGDEISVLGYSYRVVAMHNWGDDLILLPFLALPENMELDKYGIVMAFHKRITDRQFSIVSETVQNCLGDSAYMPQMPEVDQYQMQFYKSVLFLMAMTAAAVSLNYIIVYQYILDQRKRQYAVFMICGLTKSGTVVTLVMECMVLLLPGIILGSVFFHFVIREFLVNLMPYLDGGYDLGIYGLMIVLFGIAFIISFGLIQRCIMTRLDLSDSLRKKR